MHSSFPAVDALSAYRTPVYFNFGTVRRLDTYRAETMDSWVLPTEDFYAASVQANPGLPRLGRDLRARLLRVPGEMPLVLLAATHHTAAFYAIFDLQEQAVHATFKAAYKTGRVEIAFTSEADLPAWSAMHLDEATRQCLQTQISECKRGRSRRDDLWRDKFGLLLLSLPALLTEVEPVAGRFTHHAAVLFSANRSGGIN